MSGLGVGFVVEGFVTVLLGVTVGYCVVLDRRLQRFRKDEGAIRQTVVDLAMATERAETAIAGLRNTIAEADGSLSDRLRLAERFAGEFDRKLKSGDEVLSRIMQIVHASRAIQSAVSENAAVTAEPIAAIAPEEPAPVAAPDPADEARAHRLADTLASARAMAERIRARRLPPLGAAAPEPSAA